MLFGAKCCRIGSCHALTVLGMLEARVSSDCCWARDYCSLSPLALCATSILLTAQTLGCQRWLPADKRVLQQMQASFCPQHCQGMSCSRALAGLGVQAGVPLLQHALLCRCKLSARSSAQGRHLIPCAAAALRVYALAHQQCLACSTFMQGLKQTCWLVLSLHV